MSFEKLPTGTRGAKQPPRVLMKAMQPLLTWVHRRRGDQLFGVDLLYLTTRGARSGELRTVPVARFDDGRGGWYVVASYAGAARHPAWYHNLAAHPDEVWAEVEHRKHRVRAEQLPPPERDRVFREVIAPVGPFAGYAAKTDRVLPVIRLTPVVPDGEVTRPG